MRANLSNRFVDMHRRRPEEGTVTKEVARTIVAIVLIVAALGFLIMALYNLLITKYWDMVCCGIAMLVLLAAALCLLVDPLRKM